MPSLPRFKVPQHWPNSRRTLRSLACALTTAATLSACHNFSDEEQRQADVIDAFYRIHLKTAAPGLPGPEELKQYQPLLSKALFALLTQTEDADARYRAATGPQAPPLIEGDLFTSLYEGATSFSVDSCDTDAEHSACQVSFRYKKDGSDESWSDKILLIREQQQWRIDDIEFIGNDQSSQREYLSDTLTDALHQPQ